MGGKRPVPQNSTLINTVVATGEDITMTTNLPLVMVITKSTVVITSQNKILNIVNILSNLAVMGILNHRRQPKAKLSNS